MPKKPWGCLRCIHLVQNIDKLLIICYIYTLKKFVENNKKIR
jgi:hypothetical protein